MKKFKSKNEFRYNYRHKHMTYVFGDDGSKYKSVGITHSPKTFGKSNMPLESNPQKNKTEKAYIRNGIISDVYNYYDKKKKTFSFSKNDFRNVKAKVRNYKKKK